MSKLKKITDLKRKSVELTNENLRISILSKDDHEKLIKEISN